MGLGFVGVIFSNPCCQFKEGRTMTGEGRKIIGKAERRCKREKYGKAAGEYHHSSKCIF